MAPTEFLTNYNLFSNTNGWRTENAGNLLLSSTSSGGRLRRNGATTGDYIRSIIGMNNNPDPRSTATTYGIWKPMFRRNNNAEGYGLWISISRWTGTILQGAADMWSVFVEPREAPVGEWVYLPNIPLTSTFSGPAPSGTTDARIEINIGFDYVFDSQGGTPRDRSVQEDWTFKNIHVYNTNVFPDSGWPLSGLFSTETSNLDVFTEATPIDQSVEHDEHLYDWGDGTTTTLKEFTTYSTGAGEYPGGDLNPSYGWKTDAERRGVASHTYAIAGTYTITKTTKTRLKSNNITTKQVTVVSPPSPPTPPVNPPLPPIPPGSTVRQNLIPNPSFEVDLAGITNSAVTSEASDAPFQKRGAFTVVLKPTGATSDSFAFVGGGTGAMRLGMQAGKTYTFSAYGNVLNPFNGTQHANARRISITHRIGTGVWTTVTSSQVPQGVTETRVSVTATLPAGTTEVYLRIHNGSNTTSDWIFWDGLLLEEAASVGSYFDGDTPDAAYNYYWSGQVHNSISYGVYTPPPTFSHWKDRVRLEVAETELEELRNLVKNPGGYKGAFGWVTPLEGSTIKGTNDPAGYTGYEQGLLYTAKSGTAGNMFMTEPILIDEGKYVNATWDLKYVGNYYKARIEFLNDVDTVVDFLETTYLNATGKYTMTPRVAPSGATKVRLKFVPYANNTGGTSLAIGWQMAVNDVMLAFASTSAEINTLNFVDSYYEWVDIIDDSFSINVSREAMSAGSLVARVLSDALDPSRGTIIRPGNLVRLTAARYDNGNFDHIFEGEIENANVQYIGGTADIELEAYDNNKLLAGTTREQGVAKIVDLPFLLEGARIPWIVNGVSEQVATATVVSENENAKLLDQIVLARDSDRGFTWIDRFNNFVAMSAANYRALPSKGVIDENFYSIPDVSFNTEDAINSVTVKVLSINTEGETIETTYGPYTDAQSIDEWGLRPKEFTIHGTANPETYANSILAANATPVSLLRACAVPIYKDDDFVNKKVFLDLYDKVTTVFSKTSTSTAARITTIEHEITNERWDMALGFQPTGFDATPISVEGLPQGNDDVVVAANPMALLRSSTSDQSIPNTTWTKVNLTATPVLLGGMTSTASVITVPESAYYDVNYEVGWAAFNGSVRRQAQVETFTSEAEGSGVPLSKSAVTTNAQQHSQGGSTTTYLAAGTKLRLVVWHNVGSATNILNSSPPVCQLNVVKRQ